VGQVIPLLPALQRAERALETALESVKLACLRLNEGLEGAQAELDSAYDAVTAASLELARVRNGQPRSIESQQST
jgi:hypothetical protein